MAMKRTELGANCVLAVGLNDYDSADFKDRSGQVLTVLPGDLHYVTCVGWRYFDAMLEASGALQTNGDSEICDDTNSIVYEAILVKPDGTIQRGEQYHNHLEFWYQTGKMIDEGARYFVTQYTTPEDVYVKPERYIIWLLDKDYEITNNDVMEVSIK